MVGNNEGVPVCMQICDIHHIYHMYLNSLQHISFAHSHQKQEETYMQRSENLATI